MNQYTTIPNPSNPALTLTCTYNPRGDLTSDGRYTYTYDAANRMTEANDATNHTVDILYAYDSQGRIISTTRQTSWTGTAYATSTTTKFAWDGNELIAETDASGNLLRSYLWGPGIAGTIGALLSVTDYTGTTPVTYRAISDASGNVVQLLAPTGQVAANFTYSPTASSPPPLAPPPTYPAYSTNPC